LHALLTAYWELIADDRSLAWRASSDYLEECLQQALALRAEGRVDAQLSEAWEAHLEALQNQLPYITAHERTLIATVKLKDKSYRVESSLGPPPTAEEQAASLSAGQYIDRYLRERVR
jgi:hypothetical protein